VRLPVGNAQHGASFQQGLTSEKLFFDKHLRNVAMTYGMGYPGF